MATAAELTFCNAVRVAEGVRQVAKAAAFAAYGFVAANLATYIAALQAADNAYVTSVNSAANTLGAAGYTIPNSGTPNPGNVVPAPTTFMPTVSVIGNGTATMGAIC
jgi:hypothetical protein